MTPFCVYRSSWWFRHALHLFQSRFAIGQQHNDIRMAFRRWTGRGSLLYACTLMLIADLKMVLPFAVRVMLLLNMVWTKPRKQRYFMYLIEPAISDDVFMVWTYYCTTSSLLFLFPLKCIRKCQRLTLD